MSQGAPSPKRQAGTPDAFGAASIKPALLHFLGGKTLSALAGLTVTVLAARRLEPREYATYAVLLGAVYILGCVTSLGLVETMQRYLPALCIHRQRGLAMRTMRFILGLRLAVLFPAVAVLVLAAPALAALWDLPDYAWAVQLAGPLFLATTLMFFACQTMETMMLQSQVKWLWVLVSSLRLGLVGWLAWRHGLDLHRIMVAETAAFGAGGVAGLAMLLAISRPAATREAAPPQDLRRRMVSFAGLNYLMGLAAMFQSNALSRLVAANILPAMALAEFGFVQALADTVNRYMPHTLLLNTLRPVLMASFAKSRDTVALNRHANLFLKLNLFLLAPVMVLVGLCDGPLAGWISNGRYPDQSWMLLGLTGLLVQQCHYRRLELQAHAAERSGLLLASHLLVIASLAPATLLAMQIGAWGLIAGVALGCLGRDALLMSRLGRAGVPAGVDLPGLLRLAGSAGAAYLLLLPVVPKNPGPLAIAGLGLAGGVLFLAVALVLRPFSPRERDLLNSLLGRRLFPW